MYSLLSTFYLLEFLGMIRDRLISLFDKSRTSVWFENQTGINRYRWGNIRTGKARLSDAEIEAVVEVFPQYALWLVTGNTAPECGQISPDDEEANLKLKGQKAGSR